MHKSVLYWIAFVLLMIGGLNWGLYGLFNGFDLVAMLFGSIAIVAQIVYVLVGLSAIWMIVYKLTKKKRK